MERAPELRLTNGERGQPNKRPLDDMSEYTKGPWSIPHFARDDISCNCGHVFSDFQHGMGSIATVHSQSERSDGAHEHEPVEIAKANAHLIATAPELLEACIAFVAYDEGDESDGVALMAAYNDAITKARAAIARAKGGE